jgi:hypothetical protein
MFRISNAHKQTNKKIALKKSLSEYILIIFLLFIIISIMLLIFGLGFVFSHYDDYGVRSRFACYQNNLELITKALEQFRADGGVYPQTLAELYANKAAVLAAEKKSGKFSMKHFDGPYLIAVRPITNNILLPVNPYVDNTVPAHQQIAAHWLYTVSLTGQRYQLKGTREPPPGN